jgi:integrating conjugative element protein (TIGR03752 family)
MPSNKALPVFAGLILIMVIFIALKSWDKKTPLHRALQAVPVAPQPDADSPADTVRTLTAHVADLKAQSASIERQNTELLNQKNELATSLKAMLTEEVQKQTLANNPEITALNAQLEALKNKLDTVAQNPLLPNATLPDIINPNPPTGYSAAPIDTIQWIEPLGTLPTVAGANGVTLTAATPSNLTDTTAIAPLSPLEPAYTVPRNATLIGSTAMTALIGKVPFKDTVSDPFPFKVIVGSDNLAANGIDIPGLNGMVFSGHTTGDWTLSCVRGTVQSVTFVFDDGTIRTLPSNSQNNISNNGNNSALSGNTLQTGASSGNSQNQNNAIGWISDKHGIPCVSGDRISNAANFLGGRLLAKSAQAASKAFAQGNVTQSVTPLGGVMSALTGNAAQYAGLNAIAGGADELSRYLDERAAQSFDVVYVDTGVELVIHIDQELPIDYDPNGRKTSYEAQLSSRQTAVD